MRHFRRHACPTFDMSRDPEIVLPGRPQIGMMQMLLGAYKQSAGVDITLASGTYNYNAAPTGDDYAWMGLQAKTDGTLVIYGSISWWPYTVTSVAAAQWYVPTTAGIGSTHWVRFTRTATSFGAGWWSGGTTGWLALSSHRAVELHIYSDSGWNTTGTATWTVDIATDSGGSNIVATRTGIVLALKHL